jgi:hypothetical protein
MKRVPGEIRGAGGADRGRNSKNELAQNRTRLENFMYLSYDIRLQVRSMMDEAAVASVSERYRAEDGLEREPAGPVVAAQITDS